MPQYEATPIAEAAPAKTQEPGHSALADWQPQAEDNDDQPILGGSPDESPLGDESASWDIGPEDAVELFVNVGRREGARPGDFVRALCSGDAVAKEDIGRIRMRDRHTFVIVRKTVLDNALSALNGSRIANRTVSAEIARPRDPNVTSE